MRPPLALSFVALLVLSVAACGSDDSSAPGTSGPASEGVDGVVTYAIEDNDHVEGPVEYDQSPPVAGPHDAVWANCGFYDGEVPNENAVHALEHGAVWITYDDVDEDTLEALAEMADANARLLVSEYPDQGAPLVLTAWNRQLSVEDLDDDRVEAFIDTYSGEDSVAPEPGASCEGGVG